MKCFSIILLLLAGVFTFSCNGGRDRESGNQVANKSATKSPDILGIKGENIVLRKGPTETSEKLINEKATKALKQTQYVQVDYTVKVVILETDGTWSKIKVVEPEWLSETHIGWIPTKYVLSNIPEQTAKDKDLEPEEYEIIRSKENASPQIFHVLIRQVGFDKDSAFILTKGFRAKHCTANCNVYLYDSKSVLPLVDKYPLAKAEYLLMADHFVSMSTFDAVDVRSWYPFQDFQYRDYGGKTGKKTL